MGLVNATVELINRWQRVDDREVETDDYNVKQLQVNMLVDTGSYYMCINEHVSECLGLTVLYRKALQLADGSTAVFDVAGPIEARFQNRVCLTDAIVLPGNSECLLGAIPMESMDVLVCPRRQELVINPEHPGEAIYRL